MGRLKVAKISRGAHKALTLLGGVVSQAWSDDNTKARIAGVFDMAGEALEDGIMLEAGEPRRRRRTTKQGGRRGSR